VVVLVDERWYEATMRPSPARAMAEATAARAGALGGRGQARDVVREENLAQPRAPSL
jgi:hypothetical protein